MEWAIRLPSLVASLASLGLVLHMAWRLSGSAFVMLLAGATLLFSQGFFGNHAATSGDYDALLTLLVTVYLFSLFWLLHQRKPAAAALIACGFVIAAACLTKGVAGLRARRWRGRLCADPQPLAQALPNPWVSIRRTGLRGDRRRLLCDARSGGVGLSERGHEQRAQRPICPRHERAHPSVRLLPDHAVRRLRLRPGVALPILAAALPWRQGKSAAFVIYADVAIVADLLLLSCGRTKIFWYLMPIYPILSVAFALSIQRLIQLAGRGPTWLSRPLIGAADIRHLVVGVAALGVLAYDTYDRVVLTPPVEDNAQAHYGQLFVDLSRLGRRDIRTVDAGVFNNDGLDDYSPQLRFYTLVWRGAGMDIRPADPNFPDAPAAGEVLVSCDPNRVAQVGALGAVIEATGDCVAVTASSAGA